MKFLSKTLVLCLLVAATLAGTAAAATLALSSKSLAAGNTTVTSCGVSSLAATRTVDNAGKVTGVSVGSIPLACSGETLSVTLVGASNVSLGTGSAVIGSCATTCSASIAASVTNFGVSVSAAGILKFSFAVVGS
jgi:hypothetical protein